MCKEENGMVGKESMSAGVVGREDAPVEPKDPTVWNNDSSSSSRIGREFCGEP